jgi:ABC-2 type transport system permease protein
MSFAMWRLRQFLSSFAALTLWTVILQNQESAFGYTSTTMISYIFLVFFLQSIILSTTLNSLGQDIYSGQISNLFVKPIKPFLVWVWQDIADKSVNLTFVLAELLLLLAIFRPTLHFPDLLTFLIFLVFTVLGTVLYFGVMLLFGVFGFWSPETWGPRFLFFIFLEFTAGRLYPLDIFPVIAQRVLLLTPFPYLSYVQTQIFLGNISGVQIWWSLLGLLTWIILTYTIFHKLWKMGLKEYGAMGR